MQAQQRKRHGERRKRLHLRQMRDAIGREPEQYSSDERGVMPLCEFECQHVRADRAQWKREEEHHVVGGLRPGAEPMQWRGNETETEQILRKRQYTRGWIERGRVPPR